MVFSGEVLAEAFFTVALTSKGFPTLGDITETIFDREFSDDLRWLLQGLDMFGVEWKDRPAVYGDRWRKPGAHMDDWQPGALIKDALPAPNFPPRLTQALSIVGGGSLRDGLYVLNRHPATHNVEMPSAEGARARFEIERDFRKAWMIARRQELGEAR